MTEPRSEPRSKPRSKHWIVWNMANMAFMKHPRTMEWTRNIDEAWHFVYKKDACADGRGEAFRVNRREDVERDLGMVREPT